MGVLLAIAFALISALCSLAAVVWIAADVRGGQSPRARKMKGELRPLAKWGAFVNFYHALFDYDPRWLGMVLALGWGYWIWRIWTEKDDRWNRRRKKATAKVREVAGRLVVVPLPQGV